VHGCVFVFSLLRTYVLEYVRTYMYGLEYSSTYSSTYTCTYSSPHCPGRATNTRRRTNPSVHAHVTELAREQDLGTRHMVAGCPARESVRSCGQNCRHAVPLTIAWRAHTAQFTGSAAPYERSAGRMRSVRSRASACFGPKAQSRCQLPYQGLEPRHRLTTLKVCQMAPPLVEIVVMFKQQGPPPQPSCGRVVGFCIFCFSFVFVSLSTTSSRGDGLFHSLPTPGALAQLEGATTSCACSQSSSLSSRHHHRISLRLKWHLGAQQDGRPVGRLVRDEAHHRALVDGGSEAQQVDADEDEIVPERQWRRQRQQQQRGRRQCSWKGMRE
jgi:hypothetical protein